MDTAQVIQPQSFDQKITGFLERRPVIYQFLRFACIGLLNTALDFLLLNTISKALGITEGVKLGIIDIFSFSVAIVQSYLWNRTWTFGSEQGVSLWKNLIRLILVGALGAIAIIFVLIGSKLQAASAYYAGILLVYLIFESVLWRAFGFHMADWHHEGHSFLVFAIVTFIGLGINVSLVSVLSLHIHLTHSDLDQNIAKILATCVSLFWNFAGYKVIVFKK